MGRKKTHKPRKSKVIWKILLAIFGLAYFFAVAASFFAVKRYILGAVSALGGVIVIVDLILEFFKVIFKPKTIKIIRYIEGAFFVIVGIIYLLYFFELI
jgi:uncharacterized membrane protein HdeD (DUF308 family)